MRRARPGHRSGRPPHRLVVVTDECLVRWTSRATSTRRPPPARCRQAVLEKFIDSRSPSSYSQIVLVPSLRVVAIFSVASALGAALTYTVSDARETSDEASVGLIARAPDGKLVSYCSAGGSYEFHDPHVDEMTVLFDSAEEAVASWVNDTQLAASINNPTLALLPADLRDQWYTRIEQFYGPAKELSLSQAYTLLDGGVVFEQSMGSEAVGHPADRTDRWVAVQAVVRPEQGQYRLDSVLVCTDAIVDRAGQSLPPPVRSTEHPSSTDVTSPASSEIPGA